MEISVAEAHNRLSSLLKEAENGPVFISKHGKAVGVLISPDEYESLRRVRAYVDMLSLSYSLQESGLSAEELYQATRGDLDKDR